MNQIKWLNVTQNEFTSFILMLFPLSMLIFFILFYTLYDVPMFAYILQENSFVYTRATTHVAIYISYRTREFLVCMDTNQFFYLLVALFI